MVISIVTLVYQRVYLVLSKMLGSCQLAAGRALPWGYGNAEAVPQERHALGGRSPSRGSGRRDDVNDGHIKNDPKISHDNVTCIEYDNDKIYIYTANYILLLLLLLYIYLLFISLFIQLYSIHIFLKKKNSRPPLAYMLSSYYLLSKALAAFTP